MLTWSLLQFPLQHCSNARTNRNDYILFKLSIALGIKMQKSWQATQLDCFCCILLMTQCAQSIHLVVICFGLPFLAHTNDVSCQWQNSPKMSTFKGEAALLQLAFELTMGLHTNKLRMLGVPLNGPAKLFATVCAVLQLGLLFYPRFSRYHTYHCNQ
jgi:hypothetical protein